VLQNFINEAVGLPAGWTEWSDDTSARVYIAIPIRGISVDLSGVKLQLWIESAPFASSGSLKVQMKHDETYTDSSLDTPYVFTDDGIGNDAFETVRWATSNISAATGKEIGDLFDEEGIREIGVTNNLNNDIDVKFKYNMADLTGKVSNQKIMVGPDIGNLVDSALWDNANNETNPIAITQINEAAGHRITAREKLDIRFRITSVEQLPTFIFKMITRGNVYTPLTQTHILNRDIVSQVVWELNQQPTINEPTQQFPDDLPPRMPPGFTGDPIDPNSNFQPEVNNNFTGYYDETYVHQSARFSIAAYDRLPDPTTVTRQSINRSFRVVVGASVYRYRGQVAQTELGQTEFTIDYATKDIVFRSDFKRTTYIQVDVQPLFIAETAASI